MLYLGELLALASGLSWVGASIFFRLSGQAFFPFNEAGVPYPAKGELGDGASSVFILCHPFPGIHNQLGRRIHFARSNVIMKDLTPMPYLCYKSLMI